MSADNWAICPRCKLKREDDLRALDIDIANAYGTVDVEEFDRMRAERDAKVNEPQEPTFREDYEFWMGEDGDFYAGYSGGCRECGFTHKFKHTEQIEVRDA